MANFGGILMKKVILITGASRGIGEATARHFAQRGDWQLVLAARSDLSALAQSLDAEVLPLSLDVADADAVRGAIAQAQARFGRIDVLVNNAGLIDPIGRLTDISCEDWGRVIDVNLKGAYNTLRSVAPLMQAQGKGLVINISSGAASSALEGWSHYCASKAGLLSLTRCADVELRGQGVRVVGLSPGTVATAMQVAIKDSRINAVSRLDPNVHIPPEWVAKAIEFLCTDAGLEYAGGDFSLKTDAGRRAVGLAPIG